MYVRSHIDTVSGDRKYIYIDENNKKYIRDKNKYYPIKKYKGVYILQKIRGGVGGPSIDVQLHLYGIKGVAGKENDLQTFYTTIDLSNIVLNTKDETYKKIIKKNKIYIFNKDYDSISTKIKGFLNNGGIISQRGGIIINHYVIIKDNSGFKVFFKKNTQYTIDIIYVLLTKYVSFYNIIYERNNKIDSNSNQGEYFLTIFSITEDDSKVNDELQSSYIQLKDPIYNKLYDSTLDKLKETYR
jgi:hypothetical protein